MTINELYQAIQPHSFVPRTTDSASTRHPALNLLRMENIRVRAPNQVIVGDLTYLSLRSGKWAYLATWKDLFTRQVVGWNMTMNMRKEWIIHTFKKTMRQQKLLPGLVGHSDQGSQYNSKEFKELLRKNGFRQSMSRKTRYGITLLPSHFSLVTRQDCCKAASLTTTNRLILRLLSTSKRILIESGYIRESITKPRKNAKITIFLNQIFVRIFMTISV